MKRTTTKSKRKKLRRGQLVKLDPKQFSLWVETYKPGVIIARHGKQAEVVWTDGRVTTEWYWNLEEVL